MSRRGQNKNTTKTTLNGNNEGKDEYNNESPLSGELSLLETLDREETKNRLKININEPVKRPALEMDPNDSGIGGISEFSCDLSKLLECFGADINKSIIAKRRRLEQYTQESMKATGKKVIETTKTQAEERKKLVEEFRKQLSNIIQQRETDLNKAKEVEERLQKLIQQQQKHQQQMRISHCQRLKTLKQLGEQFFQGIEELENKHVSQYSSVQAEMRKEMALLQKRILMDTQQQEMMNVKKSLQSMLM
ncbi:synaptonemal complex protein 3-like [Limulus polyphemus]|uniref:Synaptonemal complex protein 3-like n=1 Tax=Limulus polyphemus TaxID=6850 RepID=A0ABM1B8A8_LIMPO|nr:synaptonemal complex protein 3-like [Limulus polyphemus]